MSDSILGWDPYQDDVWGNGYTCTENRSCGAQVEYASNAYEPPWVEVSIPCPADDDAGEVSVGVPVPVLKALLAEHGLYIVDEKDKAVLDEMGDMPESVLRSWIKRSFLTVMNLAELELARREGK